MQQQQQQQQQQPHENWRWIVATTIGSIMASVVLELPLARKPESFHTIIHGLAHLQGRYIDSFNTIISIWIGLAFGLPLGVDAAVGSIASGLST
jgi:hypothetical protein